MAPTAKVRPLVDKATERPNACFFPSCDPPKRLSPNRTHAGFDLTGDDDGDTEGHDVIGDAEGDIVGDNVVRSCASVETVEPIAEGDEDGRSDGCEDRLIVGALDGIDVEEFEVSSCDVKDGVSSIDDLSSFPITSLRPRIPMTAPTTRNSAKRLNKVILILHRVFLALVEAIAKEDVTAFATLRSSNSSGTIFFDTSVIIIVFGGSRSIDGGNCVRTKKGTNEGLSLFLWWKNDRKRKTRTAMHQCRNPSKRRTNAKHSNKKKYNTDIQMTFRNTQRAEWIIAHSLFFSTLSTKL